MNNTSARQDSIALFFLVAMIVWFGQGIVFGGKVPFFRDLGTFFYPMRFSLAESLRSGELPLWESRIAMGYPLLANLQSGAFYPPHLVFLVLPFFDGLRFLFLFHYLLGATGAYFLCRRWGYPPYLALAGGLLFLLGGPVITLTNLLNHFQSAVWLPWVILAWERLLGLGTRGRFVSLSLLLLIQLLAGSPEVYAMTLGLLLVDGLRVRAAEGGVSYGKLFSCLLGTAALSLALGLAQILPTLELLLESRAHQSLSYRESADWSLHPLSLANLFFLDKEIMLQGPRPLGLFFSKETPWILSLYAGALAVPGVVLWLLHSPAKEKIIVLGCLTGVLAVAMGVHTPLYSFLFRYVPFFGLIRFPEKFLFLAHALLVFVALRGLYGFLHHKGTSFKASAGALLAMWSLLFLGYLYLRLNPEAVAQFIAGATQTPVFRPSTVHRATGLLASLERQLALTSGIVLLLLLARKEKLRPSLVQALLVALVFFDLSYAHRPYQYLLKPEQVVETPRVLAAPAPERSRLFYLPRLGHLHPDTYSSRTESFEERVSAYFWNLLPNTGILHGFEYMQEIDALRRERYDLFIRIANSLPAGSLYRLLAVMNVGFLISSQSLPDKEGSLIDEFADYPAWIYRISPVVPRAYVVSRAVVEQEPAQIVKRLAGEEFDPFNAVILEEPVSLGLRDDFHSQVEFLRYTDHQVTIQADLSGPGILVLADWFYPGWRAYVDGNEKRILRANFFFRAIPLSAGKHQVEFRYRPRSFFTGLALSLLAAGLIAIWLFLPRRPCRER